MVKQTPKATEDAAQRESDELLGTPIDGVAKLPSLNNDLSGVHHSNILCVATTSLDAKDVFPADSTDPTASGSQPLLLTGSTDKSLRVSRWQDGKVLALISSPTGSPVLSVSVHPTLPHVSLMSCMDGTHHLVDVRPEARPSDDGEVSSPGPYQSFKDHTKYVVRTAFSPDGEAFLTASHDRTVKIYVRQQGTPSSTLPKYALLHTVHAASAVEALAVATLQDDSLPSVRVPAAVFSCRDDNQLHFVDLTYPTDAADLSQLFRHTQHNMNSDGDTWVSYTALDVAPSPSSRHLVVHTDSASGRLLLLRMPKAVDVASPATIAGVEGVAAAAPFAPPLSLVRSFYGVVTDAYSRPRCAWDPRGRWVAATSDDGALHVFEAASGRVLGKLQGHRGMIRGLAVAPFGKEGVDAEGGVVAAVTEKKKGEGLKEESAVALGGWSWVTCSFDKTVKVWA
ncbi:hypothetical protein HDU96_010290 [Phlyctochytrium bullatum]|nr:hypothetical protein HDU96_010290 [Phlyctochytrium bullatum]